MRALDTAAIRKGNAGTAMSPARVLGTRTGLGECDTTKKRLQNGRPPPVLVSALFLLPLGRDILSVSILCSTSRLRALGGEQNKKEIVEEKYR